VAVLQPLSFHLTAFHGDFPELQLRMESASHLLQGGLKCCYASLLSFELGSANGRCVFSFQKTLLFCCSHFFLSPASLFPHHTHFSPLPALTFIRLPSSVLHFLIPLLPAISPLAAASPPVPAQAPAAPLTYLHSLLLFIFPLSWTFSSLFP